jgi:hypothetical protein
MINTLMGKGLFLLILVSGFVFNTAFFQDKKVNSKNPTS